jgi:hypothetical protein
MQNLRQLNLTEELPTAFSGFQPELKVVLVYEDYEMGIEGKRIFDLIVQEVGGGDAARLTVWRFDFFHSPQLTLALSRQAEEADVIIVAPRDPDHLPPQVRKWLENWPIHRRVASGAVVSVFHSAAGAVSRTSDAALSLWRAAERAGMDYFCRTGVFAVNQPATQTANANSLVKPSSPMSHQRQWGVNE